MNALDLRARQAASALQYQTTYAQAWRPFTLTERHQLAQHVAALAPTLAPYPTLARIPFKFSKLAPHVEAGFPHTLQDTILLSDNFFTLPKDRQLEVILHELVHVFQRLYPSTLPALYSRWGFTQVANPPEAILLQRRNNPDLQGYYQYKNQLLVQLYDTHHQPTHLTHSRPCLLSQEHPHTCTSPSAALGIPNIPQLEHPNEIMANILAAVLLHRSPEPPGWRILDWLSRLS